jgi:hypothetical protein
MFGCEDTGRVNIAADGIGAYPILSWEYIYEENPEVIVGLSYRGGYGVDSDSGMKKEYEVISDLPGFDRIAAVENKRVYIMGSSLHTPRDIQAVLQIWQSGSIRVILRIWTHKRCVRNTWTISVAVWTITSPSMVCFATLRLVFSAKSLCL